MQTQESEPLSLMEIVRGFLDYAVMRGKDTFPYYEDWRWHEWLYDLQKQNENEFPALNIIGKFDWDGPHPRSSYLEGVMSGLRYVCFVRYTDLRVRVALPPGVNRLVEACPRLAEKAFDVASGIEGFFE